MKLSRAGVDVAKSVFQVHAVDRHDQPRWRVKLKRSEWLDALSEHLAPDAEVGMEACVSAHHWGRALQERGFRVKLIGAQFVKPYVKSNKNDRVDAEAIVCPELGRWTSTENALSHDRRPRTRCLSTSKSITIGIVCTRA